MTWFVYFFAYFDTNSFVMGLSSGIFPSTFYCCYLVMKTQSLIEFQNSVFHLFHFSNSYFIAVVKVLFLMCYPLKKHFKETYTFVFRWNTHLNVWIFLPVHLSICPSVWHTPYLRNCTSCDHNFWCTFVKWWYLQVLFSFL